MILWRWPRPCERCQARETLIAASTASDPEFVKKT
jgi:hypothetical protein